MLKAITVGKHIQTQVWFVSILSTTPILTKQFFELYNSLCLNSIFSLFYYWISGTILILTQMLTEVQRNGEILEDTEPRPWNPADFILVLTYSKNRSKGEGLRIHSEGVASSGWIMKLRKDGKMVCSTSLIKSKYYSLLLQFLELNIISPSKNNYRETGIMLVTLLYTVRAWRNTRYFATCAHEMN